MIRPTATCPARKGWDCTYNAQPQGTCVGGSRTIAHAVSSTSFPATYGYDCNGNMVSRTINSTSYTLAYDAENRLTGVIWGTNSAAFLYEGDGNRVKATVPGASVVYIGSYFEWTGSASTMVSYYYAGSVRIAMRTGGPGDPNDLKWLVGDHLGQHIDRCR